MPAVQVLLKERVLLCAATVIILSTLGAPWAWP